MKKRYNSNLEVRQKKKEKYELKRDMKRAQKQENIRLAKKGLNCNGKVNEPETPDLDEWKRQCEFCRKIFEFYRKLPSLWSVVFLSNPRRGP